MSRPCIALLGGSFDPPHKGHLALGDYFVRLLQPDQLRIVPAGSPWQKPELQTSPEDRAEMARLAFEDLPAQVAIDPQEIHRKAPTYTIDTLRALRTELGPDASIVLLIGADQLQQLHTWKDWRQLFDYAHICAAARPGFAMDEAHVPAQVAEEVVRRIGTVERIRESAHGLSHLANDLAVDISATQIRAALQRGERVDALIPPRVLDYIKQHHLYQS